MRIINIVAIVSILYFPLSVFAGKTLNGDQIKEAFTDKTAEWQHLVKNKYGKTYYGADGKLLGTKKGSEREGGTWHISGNELCVSWGNCSPIESDSNGSYYKSNGFKRVVRIKILGDGNSL